MKKSLICLKMLVCYFPSLRNIFSQIIQVKKFSTCYINLKYMWLWSIFLGLHYFKFEIISFAPKINYKLGQIIWLCLTTNLDFEEISLAWKNWAWYQAKLLDTWAWYHQAKPDELTHYIYRWHISCTMF